ncbi:MAG TPA: 50S ribosomal protein L13 [Thermotogota bacterium]|nr:50S ribosomal protein L13 [Thermotogota bacterium]HPJ88073.1 50S ribosomal protein L13 [Thermotogota bacterium]HPR96258.1 50S ribosomal protein L13 [Thermotogota bacterium]
MKYQQRSFRLKGDETKKWYVIDAEGQVLGRMATQIANILSGKNKPQYTPNVDSGDFVVVINADKVKVTGKKMDDKIYRTFSRYPGHMKEFTMKEMLEKHPESIVTLAVKRMLPRNRIGRTMFKKLKVYAGDTHPHAAQNPQQIEL